MKGSIITEGLINTEDWLKENATEDSKTVYNFSCQQYCKFESSDEESDIDHFDVPPILSKIGCHIVTIWFGDMIFCMFLPIWDIFPTVYLFWQ